MQCRWHVRPLLVFVPHSRCVWFLRCRRFFSPSFQLPVTSPTLRGGYIVVLCFFGWWFVGVSYVFSTWCYILGDCSGWLPMNFGEMDHLPYRHTQFVPSISMEVLQISIFDRVFCSFSCFSGSLHDLCLFLLLEHSLLSLFRVGFFPCGFLYFSIS